jgi:hypothetical protein
MLGLLGTAIILMLTLAGIAYFAERRSRSDGNARSPALQLLPGDIKYESPSGNVRIYFPVTTSIVLSIVLTLVMRLLT